MKKTYYLLIFFGFTFHQLTWGQCVEPDSISNLLYQYTLPYLSPYQKSYSRVISEKIPWEQVKRLSIEPDWDDLLPPYHLNRFKNLRTLFVHFTKEPPKKELEEICDCKKLVYLSLALSYKKAVFPECIKYLKNLQFLGLFSVRKEIPEFIYQLPRLRILGISLYKNNAPLDFSRLSSLQELTLKHLRKFPAGVEKLPQLCFLNIMESKRLRLPKALGQNTSIRSLYINIDLLDDDNLAVLRRMKQLEYLNVDTHKSGVKTLPEKLKCLNFLKILEFSVNMHPPKRAMRLREEIKSLKKHFPDTMLKIRENY